MGRVSALGIAAIDRGAKALERDYVDALKQVLSSDIEDAMKAQLLAYRQRRRWPIGPRKQASLTFMISTTRKPMWRQL